MPLCKTASSLGRPRRMSMGTRKTDTSVWSRLEEPLRRFYAWKSQYQYLGRYSVEKLCAFHHYQEHTSLWRAAAVIVVSPLPVFLALLLMDVVPMNDPRAGPAANGVAFARSVIAHAVLPSMILLSTKQALQLSDRYYSIPQIFRIGVCVSLVLEFFCVGGAFVWRFPVPFREVTAIPLFAGCVVFFNWYFGWHELKHKIPKLKRYLPLVTMQLSMYYSFLCLAVAFAYFSSTTQVVLVLVFPAIKLVVKRAVWTQAQKLDDLSTDVTICFVELTGALYQTVCLQYAKSQALQYVILFSDMFQALYEVRAYVFHEYITDGVSTVHTPSRRLFLPTFLTAGGSGNSVFLKPKMVRKTQTKRLLDLNQYKYEVDLAVAEDAETPSHPAAPKRAGKSPELVRGLVQLAATERAPPTAMETPIHRSNNVPILKRRRSADLTMPSARSAVSSNWSHYRQSSTHDDSAYGISRGTISSASMSSTCISPAQQAPATAAVHHGSSSFAPKPRVLPPLRRTSSQFASLGNISLGYTASSSCTVSPTPRTAAFSVYDPAMSSAPVAPAKLEHHGSIVGALMDVEAERARQGDQEDVRRSSTGHLKPRKSKRGSALVHPDVASLLELETTSLGVEAQPVTHAIDSSTPEETTSAPNGGEQRASKGDKRAGESVARATRVMIDGIQLPRKDQARVLEQTLQLLFSCEVLVFVEFLEVLLPTLYGLVVGGLWPLYNARYNLLFISMEYDEMVSTVSGSLLYAALESVSLWVLVYVMKQRYGISALHLLAFVLEKYWKVLYGKLVGSFLVVWLTLTVHLGVDFTFTFDYGVMLARSGSSRFQ